MMEDKEVVNNNVVIIDGDIILYRFGFSYQKTFSQENFDENKELVLQDFDNYIKEIIKGCQSSKYIICIGDKENFRFKIKSTINYKGNRKDNKPFIFSDLKNRLKETWKAVIVDQLEGDDTISIISSILLSKGYTPVIASIDKDFNQIEGYHYNFAKNDFYFISPLQALQCFYTQMLVGDQVDSISGCKGIGAIKAGRIIDKITLEGANFIRDIIYEYTTSYGIRKGLNLFLDNFNMLRLLSNTTEYTEETGLVFPEVETHEIEIPVENLANSIKEEVYVDKSFE